MFKKLMLACMAIAAFAAITASSASAVPTLTHPTGTVLATGTKITATNVGNTKMTVAGFPTIECTHAFMTGTLTHNDMTNGIMGNITAAGFNGTGAGTDCTFGTTDVRVVTTEFPWCLASTNVGDGFIVRGGGCTEAEKNIVFDLELTPGTVCTYSKASVPGTFTTDTPTTQDAVLTVSEQEVKRSAGGFLCPSSGKLDMSFTLETDTTPASDPMYIS